MSEIKSTHGQGSITVSQTGPVVKIRLYPSGASSYAYFQPQDVDELIEILKRKRDRASAWKTT